MLWLFHLFVSLWTDPAFWNKLAPVELEETSDLSLWPSTALTPQRTEQSHQFLSPEVRWACRWGRFFILSHAPNIYLFHHISESFLGKERPSKISFGSPNFKQLPERCSYNLCLKPSSSPAIPSPLHVLTQFTHLSQPATSPNTLPLSQAKTPLSLVLTARWPCIYLSLSHSFCYWEPTIPWPLLKTLQCLPIVSKIKTTILTQDMYCPVSRPCLPLWSEHLPSSPSILMHGPAFTFVRYYGPPNVWACTDWMFFRPERPLLPFIPALFLLIL